MTGRIYAAGKDVVSDSRGVPITEGDLISYSYFTNCGVCWSCVSNTASCLDRYRNWLGVPSDDHPYFHAAFGEYYYLRGNHWIFKVPDELSDDLVSKLLNVFCTQLVPFLVLLRHEVYRMFYVN